MTTRVVKGSAWSLAGQILPLAVSLVATPFTIRLLGVNGYGVFVFVTLLPTFLVFADLGMAIAATKFGSEAHGDGDPQKEARVVRSAAVIAACSSIPVAALLIIFAEKIVMLFSLPTDFVGSATTALRLASITLVVNFLSGIFKSPQLARIRLDTATMITAVPRMLGTILVPIVIYLGFGIVGAFAVLLSAAFVSLLGHIVVSRRFLPALFGEPDLDRSVIRQLLQFGFPFILWGIAGMCLQNLDKLVLAKSASVDSLAYYSVAFSFAIMGTMFANAMLDSLIPAFSQMLAPEKRADLRELFARAVKVNVLCMIPALSLMFVVARPLFTVWAGEEFGSQSTGPFHILLVGLFFSIVAYIPLSILIASGRSRLLATMYWAELVPYAVLAYVLTTNFGIKGAAAAWSLRVFADAFIVSILSKRATDVSFENVRWKPWHLTWAVVTMLMPVIVTVLYETQPYVPMILFPISLIVYAIISWRNLIDEHEREWAKIRLAALKSRFG